MSFITRKSVDSYACCELFFRCEETLDAGGGGAMVDSVRGATFSPAQANGGVVAGSYSLTNQAGLSNAVYPECVDVVELVAGSFPDFKQRHVIIFAAGRVVDPLVARVPLGSGLDGAISHSFFNGYHGLVNGDGIPLATTAGAGDPSKVCPVAGTDVGMIVEYSPNTSFMVKTVDLDGATFGSGASETIITGTVIALGDLNPGLNNLTRFAGLAFYSICAFSFDAGLPANRESQYKWMLKHHAYGDRTLPHGWRTLASSR